MAPWIELFMPNASLAVVDSVGAVGLQADGGMGLEWELESNWPFANWVWWGIALFSLIVVLGAEIWGTRLRLNSADGTAGGGSIRGAIRWWLLVLRCASLAVILWMLGGWQMSRYEIDLPDLIFLLDRSESMTMPMSEGVGQSLASVESGGVSRWQAAKRLLAGDSDNLLERLEDKYRLRLALVGETYAALPGEAEALRDRLASLEANDSASRLGDAISQAVEGQRGRSTSAIILVSDGHVTEGLSLEQAGALAASERLPVFVIKTGSELPPPNIQLVELLADSTVMVGDQVRVMARVRWQVGESDGVRQGRPTVRLVDGDGGRVLSEQQLAVSAGQGSEQLDLVFTATEAGLRRLRVEIDSIPGEVNLNDNVAETSVDVRDDSFRVLLVQGAPSYEFRFLKHLLERATNRDGSRPLVELISVLQTGDPRYADQDRAARRLPPVDDETLERLDLIILSDCDPNGLGRVLQSRIVDLVVRKGTSLLIIAGPNHLPQSLANTPLESVLPVDPNIVMSPSSAEQPKGWQLTGLGRSVPNLQIGDSEDVWNRAPPLYWLARVSKLRPGARVLLQADRDIGGAESAPIVISQLAGSGQVWLQLTDETFRLRAADFDANLYERYWLQLVRALSQGRQVSGGDEAELDIEGQQFSQGTAIPFSVLLGSELAAAAGGQVQIAVTDSKGKSTTFQGAAEAAGRGYAGLIQGLSPGNYRAVLASPLGPADPPSDTFTITATDQELTETTVDLPALERLAAATGGQVLEVGESLGRLPDLLPKGRAVRIRALEPLIVWNHWFVCCLLFSLLSLQWILRRRFGVL